MKVIDTGKVVVAEPHDGKLAALAMAGADLDALVAKTEQECQVMLAAARAERDQILADARAERDGILARIERFKAATRPLAE
jgi:cell division septum initiation protein DivIVA